MKQLIFVTQNKNKVKDVILLMPEFHISHIDFEIPEIQSMDIKEVAAYKIKYAYAQVKKPCFVMDTSAGLACLQGFPGPFIKYFFEYVGAEKICNIVQSLENNSCFVTTVLAYFDGKDTRFFEHTLKGEIPFSPRGTYGYAWDTIFIPEGAQKTFAEMSFDEKHSYSVTKPLLYKLRDYL